MNPMAPGDASVLRDASMGPAASLLRPVAEPDDPARQSWTAISGRNLTDWGIWGNAIRAPVDRPGRLRRRIIGTFSGNLYRNTGGACINKGKIAARGAISMSVQRLAIPDLGRIFRGDTVTGLSEWQLLERYLDRRDESAFEALVTRHGPMVLGVCRRMLGGSPEAEDAFQATFLILVRRARDLGPTGCDRALALWRGHPGRGQGPGAGGPPSAAIGGPRVRGTRPVGIDDRPGPRRGAGPGIEPPAGQVPIAAGALLSGGPDPRGGGAGPQLAGGDGQGPAGPRRELLRSRLSRRGFAPDGRRARRAVVPRTDHDPRSSAGRATIAALRSGWPRASPPHRSFPGPSPLWSKES